MDKSVDIFARVIGIIVYIVLAWEVITFITPAVFEIIGFITIVCIIVFVVEKILIEEIKEELNNSPKKPKKEKKK